MLAIDADAHVSAALRSGLASLGFAVSPADDKKAGFAGHRGLVRRLLAADTPDCDYVEAGDTRLVVCVTSVTALRSGAPALIDERLYVVDRDQPLPRLLAELAAILSGRAAPPRPLRQAALTEVLDRRAGYGSLTARERLVLRHLARGSSATEVARTLGTSVNTVRAQIAAVLRKLDASSQQSAIARSARFERATRTGRDVSTFGLFADG